MTRSFSPVYHYREMEAYVHTKMYMQMFIAALLTIAPKCPSPSEWINKMYIYVMEYCLTVEKDGVLIHATVGMNLENILSERYQS